ncbi:sugar transferase [Flavicella sediminum]|uniref:sugar transferase n=1 Tax=Flavicella sediminum TaxID=2585141 RepID=UPI0011223B6A|nr:sugar transferase [Flavicella sediminum]
MNRKKKKQYLNISERKVLLRTMDFLAIVLGLYFLTSKEGIKYISFENEKIYTWFIVFYLYFLLFGNIFELYNLKLSSSRYATARSAFVTVITTVLFYIFTPFITPSLPNDRIEIVYFFLVIFIPILFFRLFYTSFIFSPLYTKSIVLIGGNDRLLEILDIIEKKAYQNNVVCYISDKKIECKNDYKFINIKDANLIEIVEKQQVDEVVISSSTANVKDYNEINKQFVYLFEHGINMKSIENMYEEITYCVAKGNLDSNFYKYLSFSHNHENAFYLFYVRFVDVFISVFGLISLLLISPFVFIGNLIANKGPLFYKQTRVGKKGKTFNIYKFRSMIVNAEKNGAVWASKNDARITSFGKFLRKSRIDEIPQFWNIFVGDMSLIGPRPERPEFVESLRSELPFYAIRHVVKPGLTGWAQVMFPYAGTIEEQEIKLRYDLYYIKSRGVYLDFKIFIKTISTIIHFKGQ